MGKRLLLILTLVAAVFLVGGAVASFSQQMPTAAPDAFSHHGKRVDGPLAHKPTERLNDFWVSFRVVRNARNEVREGQGRRLSRRTLRQTGYSGCVWTGTALLHFCWAISLPFPAVFHGERYARVCGRAPPAFS